MPVTSKRGAKNGRPPAATGKKKRSTPPSQTTTKKHAAPRKAKKAKRTYSPSPDLWQAVLLTITLILASGIIAMVMLNRGKERQPDPPLVDTPQETAGEEPATQAPQQPPVIAPPAPKAPAVTATTPKPPAESRQPEPSPTAQTPQPPPSRRGTVAFVIDDAGNNLWELEPFLNFPGPLTIAVLPGLPNSAEAARRIRAAGKELFLHQPMEATGGQPPGPGAIYAGMESDEVLEILRRNLAEIGPIAGMNNHQGSRITADRQVMETVLAFCRDQGIRFLDSRTTAETAAPAVAQSLGVKIGERSTFIDNDQDRPSMNRAISGGLALAGERGSAVMIGHTSSPELASLLAELYQSLIDQGYTLATVCDLIDKTGSTSNMY